MAGRAAKLIGLIVLFMSACFVGTGHAASSSPLFTRGYTVLPEPQTVDLKAGDFELGGGWSLELGSSVKPDDVAVESLKDELRSRWHLTLGATRQSKAHDKIIRLIIAPESVQIGNALDRDRQALSDQAYKISLEPAAIVVTANAATGLFYGVQTLVQLVKPTPYGLRLPRGTIIDWPDLEMREIYWDDAHHLDHLDVLKKAIRQAAFYKVNAISLKLDGHFQYKSAPALVEPYALSPAQFQELTDYALRYHIQLIPYLDAPGHVAFILQHPEYAKLRAFPNSNYEMCTTNPDTYKLLFGMYQDLLDANKGVSSIHFGGDEPYYVGMAHNAQCDEKTLAEQLGSVGKVLAQFYTKAGAYLHARGRTPSIWGYYPLAPGDIDSVPSYFINDLTFGPKFDPLFKAHGIRQKIYINVVSGDAFFFPFYYLLPASRRFHPVPPGDTDIPTVAVVPEMFQKASFDPARKQADLIGVIDTGWADEGLHPETFWLGYAAGLGYAWHPGTPSPQEATNSFFSLFYGPDTENMGRVYQLMSMQAQFWLDSWDVIPTTTRKPIFGTWNEIYHPPRPSSAIWNIDQDLPLPPVPSPDYLRLAYDWDAQNARRVELASEFLQDNDELLDLLDANLRRVEFNRYNLQVFLAIARLYRQNLLMIEEIGQINGALQMASRAAAAVQAEPAVEALDRALQIARKVRDERNSALNNAIGAWYESWYPRVPEANGRRFVHELDDVKDHLADRTVNMDYLVYRELTLPFGEWAKQVQAARNEYAARHGLPENNGEFDWADTTVRASQ
jgi:hexosaminidase